MANFDVIVIGAGVTGLTAAKAAVQSGLRTACIEALMFGGLVVNVNELDGEISGSGTDYASNLMMEISELGVENLSETVSSIAREGNAVKVATDGGSHTAKALIIASGAKLKRLGVPGEAEFEYKGVSQCADCDGPMYKGEEVVVVGGGDSALQETLVLAEYAKTVHVVHRDAKFSAQQHLIDAAGKHANIKPIWNSVVEAILGGQMVEKVRVRNTATNDTIEIPVAGFFAYVGLAPSCDFAPAEIARDANGFLVTDDGLKTKMPGVFAAGAVRAGYGGLLTHSIAEGNAAAKAAATAALGA